MAQIESPSTLRLAVATALRRLRNATGLSLEGVANRAGLRKQSVHQLETADSGALLDTIAAIAAACGGEVAVIETTRDEVALRRVVGQLAHLPPADAAELGALLDIWLTLPPVERELMRHTGEVRARVLGGATTTAPPDNVLRLPAPQRR